MASDVRRLLGWLASLVLAIVVGLASSVILAQPAGASAPAVVELTSAQPSYAYDYRPDFARPPPAEAAPHAYQTVAASADPAYYLGRVLRAFSGSGEGFVAPRAIGSTADDWWRVSNVGRNRAGTLVPESFDLSVAGQKFTVHPNATKHMAEYATSHGGGSVPISSLAGSIESAVRGGLQSGRNFIRVGAWELGIDTRGNVIYHAVYMP